LKIVFGLKLQHVSYLSLSVALCWT